MRVEFEARDPQAETLRELAVKRITFAMRRLAWLVPRARIQLSDVNGPRGGVDKRCQIELKTDSSGSVLITSMARDWRTAMDNAIARACQVLARRWQRTHHVQRPRLQSQRSGAA